MFGEQSTTGGAPPRERQKLELVIDEKNKTIKIKDWRK